MSKSLVAFDTDRIKRYVFATSRLKEIRGASALLDSLNAALESLPTDEARTSRLFLQAYPRSEFDSFTIPVIRCR